MPDKRRIMGASFSDEAEDFSASLDPFDHLKTVKDLDFKRFTGEWWVMAHHPNEWEDGCQRSSREVTYISGILNIKNVCWRGGKKSKELDQVITIPDSSDKGKMKATFVQEKIEHRLWVHDTDYINYALVGDPKHHKMWIWTRQEKVDDKLIPKFMNLVAEYGYNPEQLMVDSKSTILSKP